QQQIGNINASNEQYEPDRAQKQPKHLDTVLWQEIVLERLNVSAPALVALGIHLGDVVGDRVHILLRLLVCHARLKTTRDQEPMKVVIDLFWLENEWDS